MAPAEATSTASSFMLAPFEDLMASTRLCQAPGVFAADRVYNAGLRNTQDAGAAARSFRHYCSVC